MELKRPLVLKATQIISSNPTRLLTEETLIENDQERVMFNMVYSDFNSLLLELAQHIKPFVNEQINKHLLDIKVKPLDRIINLYQYYIDEFVNETPNIFSSSHVNLIGYSGNDEVKEATNKILETIKNAHINCINEARRQNMINLSDSTTLVDYLMMAWEGALYQQRSSNSSKSLFVFMAMLRQLLQS
jgi:hypothetical protein